MRLHSYGAFALAALATLAAAAGDDWKLLATQARLHFERGNIEQSVLFGREALAEAETAFGDTHPNTASTLDLLAQALLFAGNDAESEVFYRRLVGVNDAAVPTAVSRLNLGSVLIRRSLPGEAETMQRRALDVFEKNYGEYHVNTAAALHGVGSVLLALGRLAEAEAMLRRALAVKETLFGPASLTTGHTLRNLALTLDARGAKTEADRLRERAAAIFK
jgi:tetratricopeptide (TPR) repeat protein